MHCTILQAFHLTWGVWQAKGCHSAACLDQEAVCMSVVAANKLDDLLTLGVCPHQAQHRQAGLCAAADKAHHLHGWHTVNDQLCQHILQQ